MTKCSLYYWSKMYGDELHECDPYSKLVQAISINLMDFNAFPGYTTCHHSYHIYHDEIQDRLLDDLELHFIELEKIQIGDIRKLRKSEQWIAYFSNQCSDEEREVLAMSEPAIKEAMKYEMYFTQDEKLRRQYEIQEKARRDYISLMDNLKNSHQRGVEEGIQQGIEQGRKLGAQQERAKADQEHALAMIQEGFLYDVIARITGLSMENVKEIAEKNE